MRDETVEGALPRTLAEHRERLLRHARELTERRMEGILADALLDEHFQAISVGREWLEDVGRIIGSPARIAPDLEELDEARQRILRFYRDHFESRSPLGDAKAAEAPNHVFLLGNSNPTVLEARTRAAAELLKDHPKARAILCGGGFDPFRSEASRMESILREAGIPPERLTLEEDSLETIGNALFGKLVLLDRGLLAEGDRVVVLTSAFHAPRSLTIFRRVFGPAHGIAAVTVDTTKGFEAEIRLATHELGTDARSSREIFGLTDPLTGATSPVSPGDHATLFCLLLLHHDLYRHRHDLRRKYGPRRA